MDVVHDRVAIEVLRGCSRGCRFCQAGMVYRPVRERTPDAIVRDAMAALACTGYEEVSLTSLSTADHSQLEEVLRRLTRRLEGTGVGVSLPSLRVDSFSVGIARLLGGGRKTGLTFAPEAGSQRLRDVINKNVTEEDLHRHVTRGVRRRLAAREALLHDRPADRDRRGRRGIGELVGRVLAAARAGDAAWRARRHEGRRLGLDVRAQGAHAVPVGGADADSRRCAAVRRSCATPCRARASSSPGTTPNVSFLEGVLARGGREVADVIEAAWRAGARVRRVDRASSRSRTLACGAFADDGHRRHAPSRTGIERRRGRSRGRTSRRVSRTPSCRSSGSGRRSATTDAGLHLRRLHRVRRVRRRSVSRYRAGGGGVVAERLPLRVCYRKTGPSAHPVAPRSRARVRAAARRAGLPYAVTQGFTPHMRIAFGPALPVGTAGLRRVLRSVASLLRTSGRGACEPRGGNARESRPRRRELCVANEKHRSLRRSRSPGTKSS